MLTKLILTKRMVRPHLLHPKACGIWSSKWRFYSTDRSKGTTVLSLMDHLKQRIKATGPISVASYMKEALTNPVWGYYMKNDVFGKEGDFTTSPEISQMFGELVAIWLVLQWSEMGKPSPFQLVELGPGRGTLMADIIRIELIQKIHLITRVFNQFRGGGKFDVHFVEVSEKMMELQQRSLKVNKTANGEHITEDGVTVRWYPTIHDVPKGLSFYVAHEFFDALPVHLFQKVKNQWREVLVDLSRSRQTLQFVVAPGPSPMAMSTIDPTQDIERCEVCPDGGVVMSCISQNIAEHGGGGLVIDYGELRSNKHSLRGFKDHALVEDVLESPGLCDLTADVDFTFLKRNCDVRVGCHGPITQESFLLQMGIRERLQTLLRTANETQSQQLLSSFQYLISPEKMGHKFKVLALTDSKHKIPTPF